MKKQKRVNWITWFCISAVICCVALGCGSQLSDFYIEEKCIGNHVYYFNHGIYAGGIALKVDDDGKPIKCQ